ncbi:hypothetical protein, partial [Paenibacillus sp. GCM10027626]|uniref:hypothetical protein n=1 Tax=Paenibacillus sp. GCM10027626 TaxID=3273411 RepID=UPI003625E125
MLQVMQQIRGLRASMPRNVVRNATICSSMGPKWRRLLQNIQHFVQFATILLQMLHVVQQSATLPSHNTKKQKNNKKPAATLQPVLRAWRRPTL